MAFAYRESETDDQRLKAKAGSQLVARGLAALERLTGDGAGQ